MNLNNFIIKLYIYTQRGLSLVNEFHSLGLLIMAGYYTLKLSNPLYMLGIFLASLPPLILFGWYSLHKMSKMNDYMSTKHGSYYTIQQFEAIKETRDLNRQTTQLLQEIKELLQKNA